MACPCVTDSDCIALEIVGDVLRATPIIRPTASGYTRTLSCHEDGLSGGGKVGSGLQITDDGDGLWTINPVLDPAADNILVAGPTGLLVDGYPAEVFSFSVNGSNEGAITGTPSGPIGPQPSLVLTNPSASRSAKVFGMFNCTGELLTVTEDSIWTIYFEASTDGAIFQPVDFVRYDQRYALNAGTISPAYGGMSVPFVGTLLPGASQTIAARKSLTVNAAGGDGSITDTGAISMWALVVST